MDNPNFSSIVQVDQNVSAFKRKGNYSMNEKPGYTNSTIPLPEKEHYDSSENS